MSIKYIKNGDMVNNTTQIKKNTHKNFSTHEVGFRSSMMLNLGRSTTSSIDIVL